MVVEVAGEQAVQVPGRVLPLVDRVAAVGVRHQRERLVQLDQLVHQLFGPLVVAVVVAGAVDEQQVALQPGRRG